MSAPQVATLNRPLVLDRFRRMRARTRALFDVLDPAAYYERPITLRNPIVFYEGHLPAFAVNTLLKKGLGRPGIDAHLETIFARGIDPDEEATAIARGNPSWPTRDVVQAYAAEADARIEDAIAHAELERDDQPLLRGAQALWTILEHEDMHQETLAYIWHEAPYAWKRRPEHYRTAPPRLRSGAVVAARVTIPAGIATLGTDLREEPFAWDNELPSHRVHVAAFNIDVHNVTNGEYLRYMEVTGASAPHFWAHAGHTPPAPSSPHQAPGLPHQAPGTEHQAPGEWFYRGMFELVSLPLDWPVYVTWAEADAYARWAGRRLPTEAEFHRAAFGSPGGNERRHPWGDQIPPRPPANFDFVRWDPEPVGSHRDGASAFGVHDLVGNGWEWTGDVFAPFEGFTPMASYPEYSAEFFDAAHYVMKGASPMTARMLVRPGFRNWFRPRYPHVYATFRTVSTA